MNRIRKRLDDDDTYYNMSLLNYLRIVRKEGFEQVYETDFDGSYKRDKFFIFSKTEEGILLCFDTFTWPGGPIKPNGGYLYYNWRPTDITDTSPYTASGSFVKWDQVAGDYVWAGYKDCREGLRCHLHDLRTHGTFVTPWVKTPFLWLLHYQERPMADNHNTINKERIAALPAETQAFINGES